MKEPPNTPLLTLAALVVDCGHPDTMASFYTAVTGGIATRMDGDSAWIEVGGMTVIFRKVDGYQAPTWPDADTPMQAHVDFWVDNLDEAEAACRKHGATKAEWQSEPGLRVMMDPAGHPFCIAQRLAQL